MEEAIPPRVADLFPMSSFGLLLEVECVFARPRSRPGLTVDGERVRYPYPWDGTRQPFLGTPDWDNLAKGAGDTLKDAAIMQDDRWFVIGSCGKWYGRTGESPHIKVTIRPYQAPPQTAQEATV